MRTSFASLPFGIALLLTSSCFRLSAQDLLSEQVAAGPVLLDGYQQRQVMRVNSPQQAVIFQNLIPGETYLLKIPADPVSGFCQPSMQITSLNAEVLSNNDTLHELLFKAAESEVNFSFVYPCSWNPDDPPTHYVSLLCQTCKKQTLQEYLRASAGEISITPGVAPNTLIRDVLIGGQCFDVTNVQYHGQATQIGTFSNGQSNIGFSDGVVMATGNANVCIGPNTEDDADQGWEYYTPDSDLGILSAGGDTYDMAFLEFDFRPTQSSVSFDFVFASEEYCEYVGSPFNDAFGFFISGPGISGPFNGAENIALVPSTSTYVAINNVNHLSNSAYFVNNTPPSGTLCGQTGSNSPIVNQLQFDGYTRKITVRANLQTCKTYHIKLKIADVADGLFDSAVFLKAGSFNAGSNASVQWVVDGVANAEEAYENCNNVSLVFRRVGGNLGTPLTVNYTVSGTAASGADYNGIPASVTIPAGQQQVIIPVNILADALPENPETIRVMLANLCNCSRPEEVLTILDVLPMQATVDNVLICDPGTATVSVNVQGGAGPFVYEWSDGQSEQTITPTVATDQTYTVTVTDQCQNTAVASGTIEVVAPLTAQLQSPAPQLCFGQADSITVLLQGTPPYTINYTLDGMPQPPITNIQGSPFRMLVTQPGTYELTSVSSGDCTGQASGTLVVTEAFIDIATDVTPVQCAGLSNGSIVPQTQGGQAPYSYTWSGPQAIPDNAPQATNLQAGTYFLTVTDAMGCRALQTYTIEEPPVLTATVAGVQGANCDHPAGGSIDLDVDGGTAAYQFLWNDDSNNQNPQNLVVGTYTVTVTDAAGCSTTATADVTGDFTLPVAMAQTTAPISCTTLSVPLNGAGSSAGADFSYLWTASNGGVIFSGNTTLNPVVTAAGTYTLTVRNNHNGCSQSIAVQQVSIVDYPNANAGPDQELTCVITEALLDGSNSSQGNEFLYQWTTSGGGNIQSGQNTAQALAIHAGAYTLQVTNISNGCTSNDLVMVTENTLAPEAFVAMPDSFTCTLSSVTLDGGSNPLSSVSYHWSTMDGQFSSGTDMPDVTVTEPGTYNFIVSFDQTGCADTVSVSVVQNYVEPLAIVTAIGELNCSNHVVTLDASASILGPSTTLTWSTSGTGHFLNGDQTLAPQIDAPGLYSLYLLNGENFCSSTATILIEDESDPPHTDAGNSGLLTCNIDSLLLGDPLANPAYTYSWVAASGGNILSDPATSAVLVDAPGTYFLTVFNPANGCTGIDSAIVQRNEQLPLAAAVATDSLDCLHLSVQLSGAGSSTGTGYSYAWSSSSGNGILAGGQTLSPIVSAPAEYILTVTNIQTGCQSTASTTVYSNAQDPGISILPPPVLSCTNHTVQLDATGSQAGSGMTYVWSSSAGPIISGQGTLLATVSQPGPYTLAVTNNNNFCSASMTVNVSLDTIAPLAVAGPDEILLCTLPFLVLDGTGSSSGTNISYGWTTTNSGHFISTPNILQPSIDQAGTYQILVTNLTNGCTASDQVEIGVDPNSPLLLIGPTDTLTCAVNQVLIDAAGSSAGSNFMYQWTGPGVVNGPQPDQIQASAPGDYTLLIVNTNNGCITTKTIVVAQDTLAPLAQAGADITLNCTAPSVQIGNPNAPVSPHLTYTWTGPGIVTNPATPALLTDSAGVYNLLVVNLLNGCTATDDVLVSPDFNFPLADAGNPFLLDCTLPTDTINATASQGAGFVYEWTTDTGHFISGQDVLNPVVDAGGNYFLTVQNLFNGCVATDSVVVQKLNNEPVTMIADPLQLTCARTHVGINANGTSSGFPYIVSWSAQNGGNITSGPGTLSPVVNQPGTYVLQVTDQTNNCVTIDSVVVTQNITIPELEVGTGYALNCITQVLNIGVEVLTPGTHAFQWIPQNGGFIIGGGFTAHPFVTSAGTYQVFVLNLENGCLNMDSINVISDQILPDAIITTPDTLTCEQTLIPLSVFTNASDPLFAWNTVDGNFVEVGDSAHVLVDAHGIYDVTVTNTLNGCTTVAYTQVLEIRKFPVAEAGGSQELTCTLTTLQLNGAGSSMGSQFQYQWTTDDGVIQNGSNTLMPMISDAGTYQLMVTDTTNGCVRTDEVYIEKDTLAPSVVIPLPENLTCLQQQVPVHSIASSGNGSTSFEYAWSTGNGSIVGDTTSASVLVDAAGDYLVIITDLQNGCTSSAVSNVAAQVALPNADAGTAPKLTCTVKQVTLQGTATTTGTTFAWTTTNGHFVNGTLTLHPIVNQPGTYWLTVLDEDTGCSRTDSVEVLEETNIPTNIIPNLTPPSCRENDGIIFFEEIVGGVGPFMYSIDDGITFGDLPEFENLPAGQFELVIKDSNGCTFRKVVDIPDYPDPNIDVIPEINLELGQSSDLQATVAGYPFSLIDTVVWTPNTGLHFDGTGILDLLSPTVAPTISTEYFVTLYSKDGCFATDSVLVRVDDEPHVYIPNAFSPWDDNNKNDIVLVFANANQITIVKKFYIFDRWGNLVFAAENFPPNDPQFGWNGRYKGKIMDPAVFTYYAVVEIIDGRLILKSGDITLVK